MTTPRPKTDGLTDTPSRALSSPQARVLGTAAVFVAALALYTRTLAPTVTLVDSGELIVAADSLGVAHPPGFPLYVLLAHAATWLPIGNVAFRVNFLSALFGAAAAAACAAVVFDALTMPAVARRTRRSKGGRKRSGDATDDPAAGGGALIAALVAALMLACSRTLWAYATLAEVYTLNTFLILLIFWLMFRWRRRVTDTARLHLPSSARPDRWLYGAAAVFGLALGVHHVTVGLTLPALALLVYRTAGGQFFTSRRFAYAALCAFAGLAIYGYLPLAAAQSPLLNWGNPRTLQRLWWHVTGAQYQSYFAFSPGELGTQVVALARRASREFGPWWLPAGPLLIAIGCGAMRSRDRVLFHFLGLVVACNVAYALSYAIAEDMDAYYLPTFAAAVIAAGFGAQWVLLRACAASRTAAVATVIGLLLVPAVVLAGNFPFNDRSRYFIAHDYADNILRTIEPNGLLLTLDWQVYAPLLYTRTIERQRRDVTVVDANLLRRSWYFDYLRREYPALIESARDQVEAFLEDLRHWEQDPALYQRDRTLNRRIDDRFHAMLLAFVAHHLRTGPVYVTQDIAVSRASQDARLTQLLTAAYQLVPQGLVFQLVPDRDFHAPAMPQLQVRGLADGSLRFEPDDVVQLKVFPVYVSMLYNRGRYLSLHGDHVGALAAFKRALALDPSFAPAQQALAGSLNALRKRGGEAAPVP